VAEDYWGGGYWGDGYWGLSYWGQGGTAVVGGDSRHYYYDKKRPEKSLELFMMVKELLENMK
jgi:hypothetical protein